jgi:hypothetical protein
MIGNIERIFYTRNMPHIQPYDATFSVMFRLAGSLPLAVIEQLRKERDEYCKYVLGFLDPMRRNKLLQHHAEQQLRKFHDLLDSATSGPRWLEQAPLATIVAKALHYWDGRAYELLVYCIMPNHVHAILSTGSASTIPLPDFP